jgi:hypothetical protein
MSEEKSKNPIVQAFLEDEDFQEALQEGIGEDLSEKIEEALEGWDFSDDITRALIEGDEIEEEVEEQLEAAISDNEVVADLVGRVGELEEKLKKQELMIQKLTELTRQLTIHTNFNHHLTN